NAARIDRHIAGGKAKQEIGFVSRGLQNAAVEGDRCIAYCALQQSTGGQHASCTGSARDSQYSFYKGCVCHHHVRGADSPAVLDAQRTVALITDIEVTGVLPDRFFAADSNRADAAQSIAADIADRIVDCAAALDPKGAGAEGASANDQLSGVGPVRSGTGDCHFTDSVW